MKRDILSLDENPRLTGLAVTIVNTFLLLITSGSFLKASSLAGRDLVGAYSLSLIFPTKWSSSWFLGYPPFHFYPPGFFALSHYLGALIGDLVAFKLLVFFMLAVFPGVVYFTFGSIFDNRAGLLAGLLGIMVIFRSSLNLLYQTLQVGLVAQLAGLLLLLLLMNYIWREDRGSSYITALITGLLPLVHPFLALVAVIYIGLYLVLSKNIYRTFMASVGFLLSATWWIPAIEYSWYTNLFTGPVGQLINIPWVFLPLLIYRRDKKTRSLGLLAAIMFVMGLIKTPLAIQSYRFFIYGQIFAVLGAAPGLEKLINDFSDKVDPRILYSLVTISIVLPVFFLHISPAWNAHTSLDGVSPREGRMIVETSHSDLYDSYRPQQVLPLRTNVTAVNGLYADSSVSSPYILGLEKSFARDPVPNPIAITSNLSSQQIEARMAYLNITYALVRTPDARENLPFMSRISSNNDFILLQHNQDFNYTQEHVITVSGPRERWKDLNQYIFSHDLVANIVYIHDGKGMYPLDRYKPAEILDLARRSNSSLKYTIKPNSIRPSADKEAVFGLRAVRTD